MEKYKIFRNRCPDCKRFTKGGIYYQIAHQDICPSRKKLRPLIEIFNEGKPREINFMMGSANYWVLQQVLNEYLLETLLDETVL